MGPTTRAGKELQLQPKKVEVVVNSLLYFVQNAMVGDCHSDPTLSEAEIQENSDWICDAICIFYEAEKCTELDIEAALEVLFDGSSPWVSSDMKQLIKGPIKELPELTRYKALVSGVRLAVNSKKYPVRFATVDRNFPSFEEFKCTEDQSTMTEQSNLEPSNVLPIPEDSVIMGNNFQLLMNEIKTLKALVMDGKEKVFWTPISSSAPVPIAEVEAGQKAGSHPDPLIKKKRSKPPSTMTGTSHYTNIATAEDESSSHMTGPSRSTNTAEENPWTQVTRKKNRPSRNAVTIGSSNSTSLSAAEARPINIFVSRLSPSSTVDDLRNYLTEKNFMVMNMEKLPSKFASYASFRVKLALDKGMSPSEVLKPGFWPHRVLVRKYYTSKTKS